MLSCPKCGRRYGEGLKHCPEDGTPLRADETVIGFRACDPLIGQVLDEKYRLDEWLGEGGMGTVYRATHLLIDRPVAVKVLHARFVEDDAAQQRFRREARAAGRLQHPNAVAVTDFGRTSEGCVYIVMELLEGRTLRDVLAQEAPLRTERAVALMAQAAAAVEAAHDAGVIHRDLKPANIFVVQRKGQTAGVKVLDFGIAKLAADSLDDSDAKNLTQTGVMIGTPRYMSPEQCDGEKLTPAADVYSLGIILYEMLAGETPFNGATPLAVALQHSSKPPRPPRELLPSIPEALERVVLHALAKKPGDRPRDAGAFREELIASVPQQRTLGDDYLIGALSAASSVGTNGNGGGAHDGKNGDGTSRDAGGVGSRDAGHVGSRDAGNAVGRDAGDAVKTPSGRLVVDLAPAQRVARAGSGDTTVLAEPAARRDTSEQRRATGAIPVASTGAELVPAHRRAFTRLQILLRGGRTPLSRRLRQPPVLFALAVALAVLFAVGAAVMRSRNAANAGDATAAASPTPAASASPQASPAADASAENSDAKGREERGREERRPARAASKGRPAKGNRVVRAFKKIFKNPF